MFGSLRRLANVEKGKSVNKNQDESERRLHEKDIGS